MEIVQLDYWNSDQQWGLAVYRRPSNLEGITVCSPRKSCHRLYNSQSHLIAWFSNSSRDDWKLNGYIPEFPMRLLTNGTITNYGMELDLDFPLSRNSDAWLSQWLPKRQSSRFLRNKLMLNHLNHEWTRVSRWRSMVIGQPHFFNAFPFHVSWWTHVYTLQIKAWQYLRLFITVIGKARTN